MPQFDITHFLPQMAWLGALFAILYFVVVRATLPRLGRVMQDREDKVLGDINIAQTAKAEADMVDETYHAALRKVQEEARTLVATSRAEAQKAIEGQLAGVDQDLAAKAATAQSALEAARAKAAKEIEAIAADAAGAIVERLTGTRPGDDKASAAAKAALVRG